MTSWLRGFSRGLRTPTSVNSIPAGTSWSLLVYDSTRVSSAFNAISCSFVPFPSVNFDVIRWSVPFLSLYKNTVNSQIIFEAHYIMAFHVIVPETRPVSGSALCWQQSNRQCLLVESQREVMKKEKFQWNPVHSISVRQVLVMNVPCSRCPARTLSSGILDSPEASELHTSSAVHWAGFE